MFRIKMINSNMRCIEIGYTEEKNEIDHMINSNMRCIEILLLILKKPYVIDKQ